VMRTTEAVLAIHKERGSKGLPLERVYRHLYNPQLYLNAYGKISRNAGATTRGTTGETVDGMTEAKIWGIIESLQRGDYRWNPVRRTEIPKANGKMRPLGIPSWSDKLVQEALRTLLEPYYEQRFSSSSHGFRPDRGCHTALREIQDLWKGTVWFIEGDIKGCFDNNINHDVLLEILRRDIHDDRLLKLMKGLLRAGYIEGWRYYSTEAGTPQGGIISPLLANVYLNELDKFIEGTLSPEYNRGGRREVNPDYERLRYAHRVAWKAGEYERYSQLTRERRSVPWAAPVDPDYRRLKFVRYADDFLLGFVGPKNEAEEIRRKLSEFLASKLKLTLSPEKTLITHANDSVARFLGYEISVVREGTLLTEGKRATNGVICLRMPPAVVKKYRDRYSRNGKVVHRGELIAENDFTIVSRFQGVLRGLYNYYCMGINVSRGMGGVRWILETSLTKTLARKHNCRVSEVYRKHRWEFQGSRMLRAVVERPGKKPLIAFFGGLRFERNRKGMVSEDFDFLAAWFSPGGARSEVVDRLLSNRCELCGSQDGVQMHHIRALRDIDRPGRRPKSRPERIMAARKRKSLAVCRKCHWDIHSGRYDDNRIRGG